MYIRESKGSYIMKRLWKVSIFVLWIALTVGFIETGFIVNAARKEPVKEASGAVTSMISIFAFTTK